MKRLWLLLLILLMACNEQVTNPLPPVTAVPPTPTNSSIPHPSARRPTDSPTDVPTPVPTVVPTPVPTPGYPAYTGLPLSSAKMGVQVHIHQEEIDEILDNLQTLGVGWVKVQVSWKLYENGPEQYTDRFPELDQFVSRANGRGLRVMLGVAKAPEWSRPLTEMDGPPVEFAQYRDFMNYLAARYRGQVAAYELWNEPNLQREWYGFPLDGALFVDLLREGAAGVRAADPDAVLISGAPAPTGINDGVTAVDDRVFLQQMIDAGVADIVDVIGAHPYGWANPPDSTAANPDPAIPSHNNHPSFFFWDTLHDYRAQLDAAEHRNMEIWVTEFGWGSFEGFGGEPPAGVSFMASVSEWQQAVYTLRAFELAQQWEWVGPMILWNLNFGPLLGTQFSESGFSLLREDGSPRPVFYGLQFAEKRP